MHKSGFVNIIGRPNVGKSTLMNALVDERMSIITNKPQTTRHRILGILSGEDFQLVFSDTPGIISNPTYGMQRAMNRFATSTFEDADVMLFVTEPKDEYEEDDRILDRLRNVTVPCFLVYNKIDTLSEEATQKAIDSWNKRILFTETFAVSALNKTNTDHLLERIKHHLPEGPAYYPKDQLTDRPERFFVSEIIRGKILELYHQEIPYSTEVLVNAFKETQTREGKDLIRIDATIFVARKSQKPILIGKAGSAIKKLGMEARKELETFFQKKVFLEMHVKIRDNWRDDERQLKHFGYQ